MNLTIYAIFKSLVLIFQQVNDFVESTFLQLNPIADKLVLILVLTFAKELIIVIGALSYQLLRLIANFSSQSSGIIFDIYMLGEEIVDDYQQFCDKLQSEYLNLPQTANFWDKTSLRYKIRLQELLFCCDQAYDFCKGTLPMLLEYIKDRFRLHNALRKLLSPKYHNIPFATRFCNFRFEIDYKFPFQIEVDRYGQILGIENRGLMYLLWDTIPDLNINDLISMDYLNHQSILRQDYMNQSILILETGKLNLDSSKPSVLILTYPLLAQQDVDQTWIYFVIPINSAVHILYRIYSKFWQYTHLN